MATDPVMPGTGGIPESFELTAGGVRIWVHPNATEHMAQYAEHMAARGASPEAIRLASQQQLRSLQAAVAEATRGGVRFDQMMTVGGWELKFGAPRAEGLLPALIHALRVGGG